MPAQKKKTPTPAKTFDEKLKQLGISTPPSPPNLHRSLSADPGLTTISPIPVSHIAEMKQLGGVPDENYNEGIGDSNISYPEPPQEKLLSGLKKAQK